LSKLSAQERAFVAATAFIAVLLIVYLLLSHFYLDFKVLLLFGLLAFVAENMGIELPQGGSVSVSSTIILATIVIFGPLTAALISIFNAVVWRDIKERTSPYRWVFNGSEGIITAGCSGLVYLAVGGRLLLHTIGLNSFNFPFLLLPILLMAATYFLINTGLVSIIIGVGKKVSPLVIWRSNVSWAIPNYLVLTILSLVMIQIYVIIGAAGLILMIIPLLIARQAFQIYLRLKSAYMGTVEALVAALEAKDPYTSGHSERVADLVEKIGRRMRLGPAEISTLRNAGILHDIGKIGISRSILRNPGRLSDEEYSRMQKHPESGALILQEIKFMEKIVPIVFHHHERFDGSGYIDGFKGEEIPLYSRILAVADAFDAMTSPRPYRPAMDPLVACQELISCSGTQFDGKIVDYFIEAMGFQLSKDIGDALQGQLNLDESAKTKNYNS